MRRDSILLMGKLCAIENRFRVALQAPTEIEWMSDKCSGYTAEKTRAFAAAIGLKPRTTPVCSPRATSWKRALCVAFMPKPGAETAVRNLVIAFEHYNEQHPTVC